MSSAIDRAVKAYIEHTDAVMGGDATLNLNYLAFPFGNNPVVQAAHQAVQQHIGGDLPEEIIDGIKKRKRTYRQRDPNAPKRPLTAYFRYLQEQRPLLNEEAKANPDGENTKAGDISKIATDRWNQMDSAHQAPYREAYQADMRVYEDAVKAYRATTEGMAGLAPALNDATTLETLEMVRPADGSDDDLGAIEPPARPQSVGKPKAVSSDTPKKTPKSTAAKSKPAAPAATAPTPKFSSINPIAAAPTPTVQADKPSTPARKRKAPATESEEGEKKKTSRKTKAEKAAEAAADDAAAAAAQLVVEPTTAGADPKKVKKERKKRKSEAAE